MRKSYLFVIFVFLTVILLTVFGCDDELEFKDIQIVAENKAEIPAGMYKIDYSI